MDNQPEIAILLVCMGNICRSPTAHGVFRRRLAEADLLDRVLVESAGTHDYHVGHGPDRRALEAARDRGYEFDDLRARQVEAADFHRFDYVLAMDRDNLAILDRLGSGGSARAEIGLFLDYSPDLAGREVPDPYYGAMNGFEEVLDLVEAGADSLLTHLRRQHRI
ncbi:low molecular weight protein-tyrosine-phosphatase [Halofilum ochraceum]|uniref:low molecular weight protein-tyrosine-phosphatase n=1 Tax=Halofilum ochraceum TaxID=1611323 RepID=UPI000830F179|nr:low molecular weight protein-tyrosine-phosphatase [Halofilum ochraceum]